MRASARPSWSASAQRRHAPPPWRWASPSATSAISRRRMKGEAVLLGVDVGGTTTAAGVVTRDGEVLIEQRVSTHRDGKGRVLPTIVGLIAAVRAEAEGRGRAIAAIGVGVPGAVDPRLGRVGEPVPHAPELAGRALAAELTERFGLPAFVDNDVNALALGEWMFGAGRGTRSLVVLAPGTGFGAGIVLESRLVRGAAGFGGELGHTPVKFDGPPCWCGGRGCLALYASGRGIAEAARARVAGLPDAPLLTAAGGDPRAITAPLGFRAARGGGAGAAPGGHPARRGPGARCGAGSGSPYSRR